MTWAHLVEVVAGRTRLTKKEADELMRVAFATVAEQTRVSIPGFGVFSWRKRKARWVSNPQTSEPMRLPPMEALGFKASKHQRRTA